jgi:hypothetical protein
MVFLSGLVGGGDEGALVGSLESELVEAVVSSSEYSRCGIITEKEAEEEMSAGAITGWGETKLSRTELQKG